NYMAPEQAAGQVQQVGPLSDVYALGAILYECLTGRPPFQAATVLETLEQVRTQEPVPPRRLQPGVPRDLETICLKCLEKDPRRRYGSALALAQDLERWRKGEPVRARPVGHAERLWRWCGRIPAVASLLGAVAVLLLAVVATTPWAAIAASAREREATRREQEATAREEEARGRAEDRQRESLVQQLQLVRREPHVNDWSEQTAKLAAAAAAIRPDGSLRKEMAAALAGVDARVAAPLGEAEASSIAIDSAGKRL